MATTGQIRLFEADPDLLELIPEKERALALRTTVVPGLRVALGAWDPGDLRPPEWGVLIVDGMFVREIGAAGSTAAELLGTGDVILAGGSQHVPPIVPMGTAWTVIESATIAMLDQHVQPAIRRWPQLSAGLLQRAERRADRLAMAQAISHLTRVDARVLMMLWLLADRWGRVSSNALVVPLRLTHRTLSRLVGARRPTVTTAVSQLTDRGLVSRRQDGSWVVHGAPPAELERVGIEPLPAQPAPPRRPAADPRTTAPVTSHLGEIRELRRRLATEIPRLAEAYEAQRDRTRELAERTRQTRDSVRAQREARRSERRPLGP